MMQAIGDSFKAEIEPTGEDGYWRMTIRSTETQGIVSREGLFNSLRKAAKRSEILLVDRYGEQMGNLVWKWEDIVHL